MSSTCRGQDCLIAVQLAPDYEGTILPVLDFKAAFQGGSSALRPAPPPSATANYADLRSTITPTALVVLEAPRLPANALLEVPCLPYHPHGLLAEAGEGGSTSQVNWRGNIDLIANPILTVHTPWLDATRPPNQNPASWWPHRAPPGPASAAARPSGTPATPPGFYSYHISLAKASLAVAPNMYNSPAFPTPTKLANFNKHAHPGLCCLPSLCISTSDAALSLLVLPAQCNSIVIGSQLQTWPTLHPLQPGPQ